MSVSAVIDYCTVYAAIVSIWTDGINYSKKNSWTIVKSLKSILLQITDAKGSWRVQFCHLSLPSASGPDAFRILPVECGLPATDYTHTYFTFCCSLYVSQSCDSAVHNPAPESGGVQYDCTQRQKLLLIVYLFSSPYVIHIKPESMLTRFFFSRSWKKVHWAFLQSEEFVLHRQGLSYCAVSALSLQVKSSIHQNRSNEGK